jgi:CcmD family protein
MIRSFSLLICLMFLVLLAQSQPASTEPVQMADAMRSNGKIYVVVAVLLTVLVGLFAYLWRLDRRISRLEKPEENA